MFFTYQYISGKLGSVNVPGTAVTEVADSMVRWSHLQQGLAQFVGAKQMYQIWTDVPTFTSVKLYLSFIIITQVPHLIQCDQGTSYAT